jgi:uncharacterized coiled-coil protein SlyX
MLLSQRPPPHWPEQGRVQIDRLFSRFNRASPWSLKGISIEIPPHAKGAYLFSLLTLGCI